MSAAATAPYSAATWEKIRLFGDAVEAALGRAGVRLTMGGEPTFVPLAPDGAEWQTAALGPTKLGYARRFAHALVAGAFPGAVILETSGKQYPGEPLPRWALLVQRRADGLPAWRDLSRLRGDTQPGAHRPADAENFIRRLAGKLSLPADFVLAAREPQKPAAPAGFVLPLDHDGAGWRSDRWEFKTEKNALLLLAGDSLAGLRLPLGELAEKNLRRALTVELRDGALTVFLPPLLTGAYLALLAAIEEVFTELGLHGGVLAGYAPPPDLALPTLALVSDPGVIEVNLSPCATWAGYDRQLAQLFAAAEKTGLCAHKLQFNGRETGTGGGAHLVFGGPADLLSPFFTFPSLLPSVIRYWQHHPALSYVFTGQFMGPSSQAPRIDESTFEALYELEIACAGAEQAGTPQNLALFDLLFRDLLMDRSGNTHRAEISVDKLWNPFAPNGRLGLVELRAFETNPARAAQSLTALFVRAILARLCAAPFREPFVRWAGRLHDRFFLPAFLWDDLEKICTDLTAHGLPFETAWLRPLWEWRFPKLGEFALAIHPREENGKKIPAEKFAVTFRQALEAWPLLGESPSAGTVSRSVDASMDRIEAGVDDVRALDRGLLLVNGYPCEFQPAGGGAAAGIRFRAFYLWPALHPHVPVHAPLLLEWVDRATLTVVAAARWHVWNPRHQPYASAPAGEAEARARHAERWEPWTGTIGQPRFVPRIDFPPEGRHTLDLRRYPAQARG
ncbi:MAG TPA: transglutaminase family protein [Opitutaceae bacterium]|nr:transglutaminase family protein [Opitutaceae bacterium]